MPFIPVDNLQRQPNSGFTLIELLLAIAIAGTIAAISVVSYQSLYLKGELNNSQAMTVQALRRAQVLATAVQDDDNWGVYLQTAGITVFKGTSYASRDITKDEDYDLFNRLSLSGLNQIVFCKVHGLPDSSGTINLSLGVDTRSISINAKGAVEY